MNAKTPSADELRDIYNRIFDGQPPRGQKRNPRDENHTRMDRALSWLERYEQAVGGDEHLDERFLFLWIAFNAAYGDDEHLKADDSTQKEYEHTKIERFITNIARYDRGYRLADVISAHRDEVAQIIDNRFLLNLFWKAEYHKDIRNNWGATFVREKQQAKSILEQKFLGDENNEEMKVLCPVFNRLYTLRNQILHGSASWRDHYNRSSIESGEKILGFFMPLALKIMLETMQNNPNIAVWGHNAYPPYLNTPDDTTQGPPRTK